MILLGSIENPSVSSETHYHSSNNALFPPSDESDDEEKDVKVEHQQLPSSSTKVSVLANNALLPPSDDSNDEEDDEVKPKNRVKFGSIEVYKFGFAQGVDTVPSNGCVSLGIDF
uniref:Uncharacterized protein n=1 Tax=Meloidogyne javanica TaxID=6303 RepID=A0A915MTZ5_MELJA